MGRGEVSSITKSLSSKKAVRGTKGGVETTQTTPRVNEKEKNEKIGGQEILSSERIGEKPP